MCIELDFLVSYVVVAVAVGAFWLDVVAAAVAEEDPFGVRPV